MHKSLKVGPQPIAFDLVRQSNTNLIYYSLIQVKASQKILEDYLLNAVLFLILLSNFECEYLDDCFLKSYPDILMRGVLIGPISQIQDLFC